MARETLCVALVTEVFPGRDAGSRLGRRLAEAKTRGAELAVLPELPLDRWCPELPRPRDEDAEPPAGSRHRALAGAARQAGIGLIGGAIVVDPQTGARHNTALLFDRSGNSIGEYRKLHLPDEDGFREARHYRPGTELPRVIDAFGMPLGIQICSDVNRPALSNALAALGAEAIVVPRATPRSTYERWKLVLRATAVTSAAYVLSTNRPAPEAGAEIGGPSIAVAPDGSVLLETEESLGVVTLDRDVVRRERAEYPGYLDVRAALYAQAWDAVSRSRGPSRIDDD